MPNIYRYVQKTNSRWLVEILLALRGLFFAGNKYICPCCGRKLRAFTYGGTSFKVRPLGYCPRCNSKARHRRDWLFLQEHTDLFTEPVFLLHVSPKYSLSRQFARMQNITYVGIDLGNRPNTSIKMDLSETPISSDTFDAIICIHVLEHIANDRQAMSEMFRVLKPGGWALISVPIRLDQPTYEDPAITEPQERKLAFGEVGHVRYYGFDLEDRLEDAGFHVELHLGREVEQTVRSRYGLRDDENVFFCTKNHLAVT